MMVRTGRHGGNYEDGLIVGLLVGVSIACVIASTIAACILIGGPS